MNLPLIQDFMRRRGIDGWLLYDFRGSNGVLWRLLGEKKWTTRRVFLLIPAAGEPVMLCSRIDEPTLAAVPVTRAAYTTWGELSDRLKSALSGRKRVAMEYSPGGELPAVSFADAGTVEMVRALGVEVISSADLVQVAVAAWSAEARQGHAFASQHVAAIKDGAFALIRRRLAAGSPVTEHEVQQHIMARFKEQGLETLEPPIVAVNAHSGNPHFEVATTGSAPIRRGDWLLLDLWARLPGGQHVFSDITWVAYVPKGSGDQPSARHREVFEVVRAARDAGTASAQRAWKAGERVQGWQLDDAVRGVITKAGQGEGIRHRTGHSLSPGPLVHGFGMNLDNLETHDTREMLPGTGFTIEPGVYGADFGVRLEINLHVDPKTGPEITSCVQDLIVMLI